MMHVWCGAQGRGEHRQKPGALQLVRPTPIGVVSYVARGERGTGRRESAYSGMEAGRIQSFSYNKLARYVNSIAHSARAATAALPPTRCLYLTHNTLPQV